MKNSGVCDQFYTYLQIIRHFQQFPLFFLHFYGLIFTNKHPKYNSADPSNASHKHILQSRVLFSPSESHSRCSFPLSCLCRSHVQLLMALISAGSPFCSLCHAVEGCFSCLQCCFEAQTEVGSNCL